MSKRLSEHLRRSGTRATLAIQLSSQLPNAERQTIASIPPQETYLSYPQEVVVDGVQAYFRFEEDPGPDFGTIKLINAVMPAVFGALGYPVGQPLPAGYYLNDPAYTLRVDGALTAPAGEDPFAVHFDATGGAEPIELSDPMYPSDPYNYDTNESFSVEFWVRTTQDPGAAVNIFQKSNGTVWPYRIRLMPGGLIEASRSDGAVTPTVTSSAVNDGEWHYVTFVRSGGVLALQIDETAAVATADTVAATTVNAAVPQIGMGNFVGDIDELAIYNRALTAGNRTRHLLAAAGGLVPV